MSVPGRWFRPPRHLVTLFLGVTLSLSLAMGWLAWQLIAQDRALASQRRQERLDNAAEAAVAAVRKGLEDLVQRLDSLSRLPPGAAAAAAIEHASALEGDAVVILAGDGGFDAWPAGRLIFYPPSATPRQDTFGAVETFARGEALEFERRDLAGALRAYAPLTLSAVPQLRAGALLRTARIQARLNRPDRAFRAYDELGALGSTLAEGLPAGLLARYGRCVLLRDLAVREHLGREAAALARQLDAGTWRLTQAEYRFYREQADGWLLAPQSAERKPPPTERARLSAAVSAAWAAWGDEVGPAAPPAGSRVVQADGIDVLFAWYRTAGRVAALAGGPRFVEARLVLPGNATLARYRARMVLADGARAGTRTDRATGSDRAVHRAATETALPWSVRIVDLDPGGELMASAARNRVVLAGLVALCLFVLAGSAFIVRAVNREVEVSRLQTDFVAAVSHEFRTPLTSIRQASELLLDGRVPEARREEYYRLQHRDSERLHRLVESLLDFGRMESGAREYRPEPLEVAALVRSVVDDFSADVAAAGYRVEASVRADGVIVSADREALGRAIWNLLDNAVKYSPSHKTVWVTAVAHDGDAEVSVRDRGVGVPVDDQRRIFDKFARGRNAVASGARGTGLGLAMVRHIVGAHGGSVRMESTPGEGSTFTITLPLGRPHGSHPDRRG